MIAFKICLPLVTPMATYITLLTPLVAGFGMGFGGLMLVLLLARKVHKVIPVSWVRLAHKGIPAHKVTKVSRASKGCKGQQAQ